MDQEVENALLKRAMGYQYEEIVTEVEEIPTGKIREDGTPIVRQIKHIRKTQKTVLPDTTAQIFWLKNRRPDRWRDRQEVNGNINVGGNSEILKAAFERLKENADQ